MHAWKKAILGLALLCSFSLTNAHQELLTSSDVTKVMQQILNKHVAKKNISNEILQNAVRSYIGHFDPEYSYLLESEVSPYLNMSSESLANLQSQYEKGDFSFFKKLDELFAKAIIRAQSIRKQAKDNSDKYLLIAERKSRQASNQAALAIPEFPRDLKALQLRIDTLLVDYLVSQMKHYGDKEVFKEHATVFANYEDDQLTHENPYLGKDPEGKILSQKDSENIFTIRILKSLASSLDAHTSVYNPEEAYDMRVRLEKGLNSVGIVVRKTPAGVFVDKILTKSPAEKNGQIHVGDRLVSINGRSAHMIPFEELLGMLSGERAKSVDLVFKNKQTGNLENRQRTYEVKLEPAKFIADEGRVESTSIPYDDGIIGVITLKSFYKGNDEVNSEKDVLKAIKEFQKQGNLKGLVLDLRENSGGFLTQAVKVAGLFVTNGVIVVSKYSTGEEHFYRDMDGKASFQGPLVILTSKKTASAAEIVAQALQDYGVAIIVGDEHTYGKGTIQSQTVTGDQAASYFKVTVGKYYTVSGKTPQLQGVKADVVVPGLLSFQEIGEEYLEDAISADKIAPSFSDNLADVDPSVKSWYLHYYMPTMQKPSQKWRALLPILRQQSAQRIQNSKDYQQALLYTAESQRGTIHTAPPKVSLEKLQEAEAINIVKDMIASDNKLKK